MKFPIIDDSYEFFEKDEKDASAGNVVIYHFWCNLGNIIGRWSVRLYLYSNETTCYLPGIDHYFHIPIKIPVNDEDPVEMLKVFKKYYDKLELI